MTDDRVYPASKPPPAANPAFPATKSQLYGASRPPFRPQAHHHRHRRGCCCRCCCWTIFAVILLILLAAAAAAVVYLLYRPTRPTFSVSSLKISTLNITSSSHIVTAISLSVTTRNPNKRVVFMYDDTNVEILTAGDGDDVSIGKGMFPGFVHEGKNTTVMKGVIGKPDKDVLDDTEVKKVRGEMKGKSGLNLKIVMDTKVRVKMGALKIPKTGIRVTCDGIRATVPNGKTATTASTVKAKCKVDLRFKIWKFRF